MTPYKKTCFPEYSWQTPLVIYPSLTESSSWKMEKSLNRWKQIIKEKQTSHFYRKKFKLLYQDSCRCSSFKVCIYKSLFSIMYLHVPIYNNVFIWLPLGHVSRTSLWGRWVCRVLGPIHHREGRQTAGSSGTQKYDSTGDLKLVLSQSKTIYDL